MALVFLLLRFTPLGVYALIIGNVTFPLLVSVLNCRALSRELGYRWRLGRTFGVPLLSSAGMGLVCWSSYGLVTLILPMTCVEPISFPQGWRRDIIKAVKDHVHVPVIGVSVIREPAVAEKFLEDGVEDFVSMPTMYVCSICPHRSSTDAQCPSRYRRTS